MILVIDPSNSHTGFALWDENEWMTQALTPDKPFIKPVKMGVIGRDKYKICTTIEKMIGIHNIKVMYIEDAALMQANTRGQVTASSGALVKLAEFIGMLIHLCYKHGVISELISVQKWKGTMSKKSVIHRIKKYCPWIKAHDDAWDAVGISLYLMGVINR